MPLISSTRRAALARLAKLPSCTVHSAPEVAGGAACATAVGVLTDSFAGAGAEDRVAVTGAAAAGRVVATGGAVAGGGGATMGVGTCAGGAAATATGAEAAGVVTAAVGAAAFAGSLAGAPRSMVYERSGGSSERGAAAAATLGSGPDRSSGTTSTRSTTRMTAPVSLSLA